MTNVTIISGILLLLIGVLGYVYAMSSGNASLTALIPAAFGLVLLILGLIAGMKENLRKHMMHAAVAVALLGFILTAGRLVMRLGSITFTPAEISQISTAVVCLVVVIGGIRSFAEARRNR